MTEADLKKMTVKDLKALAAEKTELTGVTDMRKDALIEAIIKELGIEKETKKVAADAINNKMAAKKEILRLKQKKEELLNSSKATPRQLKNIRRRVRSLKRLAKSFA